MPFFSLNWLTRRLITMHLHRLYTHSTDLGATWTTDCSVSGSSFMGVTSGNATRTTFSVGKRGEAIVYALAADLTIRSQLNVFRSDDGGLTWVSLNCNANFAPVNPIAPYALNLNVLGGQGYYNQAIIVDYSDPTRSTVYVGGALFSIKTVTGTAANPAWYVMSYWYTGTGVPYVHADWHAGAIFAYPYSGLTATYVVAGTDGGVAVSPGKSPFSFLHSYAQRVVTHCPAAVQPPSNPPDVAPPLQSIRWRHHVL